MVGKQEWSLSALAILHQLRNGNIHTRGAIAQILDEETTAQVLLGGCCFCVNRRSLPLDRESRQKECDQDELAAESQLDRENLHVYDTPLG